MFSLSVRKSREMVLLWKTYTAAVAIFQPLSLELQITRGWMEHPAAGALDLL